MRPSDGDSGAPKGQVGEGDAPTDAAEAGAAPPVSAEPENGSGPIDAAPGSDPWPAPAPPDADSAGSARPPGGAPAGGRAPRTSGVAAAAAASVRPSRASSVRNRILPRSVLGVACLILAFAVGAGFSGVVLYSYYQYTLNQTNTRVNALISGY